jgi:hypothetical protein
LFTNFDAEGDEAAKLKKSLIEKDHAILRVNLSEADLKQRLAEAQNEIARLAENASIPEQTHQAEIAKLNADWQRAIRNQERDSSQRIANLKLEAHQNKQDFERERRSRRIESAQSSSKIAHLERELADALGALSRARESAEAGAGIPTRILLAAAGVFLCCALGAWALYRQPSKPSQAGVQAASAAAPSIPAPNRPLRWSSPPEKGFAGGLDRLNAVLSGYPGRGAEDILRQVHKKWAKIDPTVCSFQWNNGQPALVYRGDGKQLDMAATLSRCADAVESFR